MLDSLKLEIREVFNIFDEEESGSISLADVTRALYTITGERVTRLELLRLVANAREAIAQRMQEAYVVAQLSGGNEQQAQAQQQKQVPGATPSAVSATSTRQQQQPLQGPGAPHTASSSSTTLLSDRAGGARATAAKDSHVADVPSLSQRSATGSASTGMMNELVGVSIDTAAATASHSTPFYSAYHGSSLQDNSDGIDVEVFEQIVMRKLHARSYDEELNFAFSLLEDKYYPGFITKDSLKRAAAEAEEPLTEAEVNEMFDTLVTGVPTAAVDFTIFASIQASARHLEDV